MREKFNRATITKFFVVVLLIFALISALVFALLASCNNIDIAIIKIPILASIKIPIPILASIKIPIPILASIKIPEGSAPKVPDGLMIDTNIPLKNLLFPKSYLPSENKNSITLNDGTTVSLGLADPYKDSLIQLLLTSEQKLNLKAIPLPQNILQPFKLETSPSLPQT